MIHSRKMVRSSLFLASISLVGFAAPQEVKVRVELVDVHCNKDKNTEDVTGADELYVVAVMAPGAASKTTVTKPFDINTDQTKEFAPDQRVIFDGPVSDGGAVEGALTAFDEDYGKDWEKKDKEIAKRLSDTIAGGAVAVGGEKGPIIAAILKVVYEVGDFLAQADKDDELGSVSIKIPADGPPEEIKEWKFEKDEGLAGAIGFSDWSYVLRYRITRTK